MGYAITRYRKKPAYRRRATAGRRYKRKTYRRRGRYGYRRRKFGGGNKLIRDMGVTYSISTKVWRTYKKWAKNIWISNCAGDPTKQYDKKMYRAYIKYAVVHFTKIGAYTRYYQMANKGKVQQEAQLLNLCVSADNHQKALADGQDTKNDMDTTQGSSADPKTPMSNKRSAEQMIQNTANTDAADAMSAQTGIPAAEIKGVLKGGEAVLGKFLKF